MGFGNWIKEGFLDLGKKAVDETKGLFGEVRDAFDFSERLGGVKNTARQLFDLLDYEKDYTNFLERLRESEAEYELIVATKRDEERNRNIAAAHAAARQATIDAAIAREERLSTLRKKYISDALEARRNRANGKGIDLQISPYYPRLDTAERQGTNRVPTFTKPIGIKARDQKATLALRSNKGEGYSTYTQEFIIQSMQEEHSDRYQLVDTFGSWVVIMYGSNPVFLTCSGQLYSGKHPNTQWANKMRTL